MSFRGSFVVGQSFQESAHRNSQANEDYDDVPVVLDIEEDEEIQQREVDFMLENNENFQGVIDPHRSAAFGLRTSISDNSNSPTKGFNLLNSSRQRKHTFKQTFGEPDISSQDHMINLERSTEIVATDEDFTFIQEVLQQAASDLRAKLSLPQSLPSILDMQDMDEVTNALHTICEDISCQFQEFQRVIDFGGFLIDQARRARQDTEDVTFQLEEKNREISELQEREAIILNDWKREQQCTRELEAAIQEREKAFLKLQEKINRQRITIDQMARENEKLVEQAQKQKPVTPKSTTPNKEQFKKTFDFKVEKTDPRIEELEELLLQKATELEQAESINEVNTQRIQQTIELNEQLYFEIDEATQELTNYEVRVADLEKINQQLITECHRLEQLVQSKPNPLMVQLMRNQGLSVDENASQRTSNYGLVMNQSQRTNNDFNDDTMSRRSNMHVQRLTDLQPNQDITQFQKLASAAKRSDLVATKNGSPHLSSSPRNQTQNQSGQQPRHQKSVANMQIEIGDEEPYEQSQFQDTKRHDLVQEQALVEYSMRESQLEAFEHFANQDEIHPTQVQYEEVIVHDELGEFADQDGLPADHFSNFEYSKRPSYLMSSRISAIPINERLPHNMQSSTLDQPQRIPIKTRLKERQDQLKRVIETTDIIEGQGYFEDIRRTFNQGTSSVLVPGPPQPGTPRLNRQEAPKTGRALNQNKKFDFKPSKLKLEAPIVNNTYITNHYNNFSPTQALKTAEELASPPSILLIPGASKKLDLVDLDHYLPSKKPSTTSVHQFLAQDSGKNPILKQPSSSRTSFARLTESMLISMPVIQEEDDIIEKKFGSQESLKVLQVPTRASNVVSQKQTDNIDTRISMDSLVNCPKQSSSHSSVASSETLLRRRSVASRKEPEEEFFFMTLVSLIMCHPKKNLVISLQQDSTKLFKICQKNNKAFFEWPKWIANYLELELQKIKEASLNKAQKLGAKKIAKK